MLKLFVLIAVLVTITGCNTLNGMGKDIEKAGEAVQKTSN